MKRICAGLLLALLCLTAIPVQASEITEEDEVTQSEIENKLIDMFDFNEIDDVLKDIFPEERLSFSDILLSIISGDIDLSWESILDLIKDQLLYNFQTNKSMIVHILLIAIIAAVFTNFSNAFQSKQISEISFYILYLLLITICLNSFRVVIESVTASVDQLTLFIKVLCPVYFLAVAIAKGSVTAVGFYNLVLVLICLVEMLILNFLLPMVHVYIMMKVLNFLSLEEYLSKFAELLETLISWTLKTLLAFIVGLNVIQGLISPAIDSVKRNVITKGAEAIPVIGDAIGGVAEVVLGTAVLLKNGIGIVGAVICIGICAVPLIEMAIMTLVYKLTAAVIQPVSDKRIVGCVSSVAEGCQMLVRVLFTVGVLFLLTVAVVAASTS